MTPTLLAIAGLALSTAHADDSLGPARVVLPWSDFQKLYDAGHPTEKPKPSPPSHWTLGDTTHTARVEEDSVFITTRVVVDVLDRGEPAWTSVPLVSTAAALMNAEVVGQRGPAPVYVGAGWYQFLTDEPGTYTLELTYAVDVVEAAGERSFTVGVPAGGAARVALTVPSERPLEFTLPAARGVRRTNTAGRQGLEAALTASSTLTASWRSSAPESGPASQAQPRVYAEHHALLGIGDGIVTGTSQVHYSILHQGVDRFRLRMPDDVTLLDVTGPGVRDWEVTEGPADTRFVAVSLDYAAEGAYRLQLNYERPLPDSETELLAPRVEVLDVERVKGFLGVDARSNLEILPTEATGARPIDVRELPAAILGQTDFPVLLGYTWRDGGRSIPLKLSRHGEVDLLVTIVDQLAAETVLTPDGRRMTRATWALRNNRGQYLRVAMPEGSTPWSVFVGGRAVKPALSDDGHLLVPLARSQAAGGALARFAVEIVYVEDGDSPDTRGKGRFDAGLPRVDVPVTAVAWTVWLPGGGSANKRSVDGDFRRVAAYTRVDDGGLAIPEAVEQVRREAQASYAASANQAGVQPVRVTLPVDGTPLYFEKLLALDETLGLSFDYKGLK